MVTLDQNLLIGMLEIVSLLIHCFDNRQTLPIVHVIVMFAGRAISRVEIDWPKDPEPIVPVKDAGDYEAACISLPNDQYLRLEMVKDRCIGEGHFELSKCDFSIPSPFPLPWG